MHFLRFRQINTKENAVVGCLIYPSLALHNKKVKEILKQRQQYNGKNLSVIPI